MNRFILLIVFIITINCQESSIIKKDEKIINNKIKLSLIDNSENIIFYHIYLKNFNDSKKSFALNHFDLSDDLEASLFPGLYDFYAYGLIEKKESSKMILSYSVIENFDVYKDKNIKFNFIQLKPDARIEYDNIGNKVYLKVFMNELSGIFSISSLSLKQGNDRYRSLDIQKMDDIYFTEIFLIENGKWYLNVSYQLYNSKKDNNVLEKDNISISTSSFKDFYLGEFYFL